MNICLEDCVFIDQKGFQYEIDNYAVRFRQIYLIQLPDTVSLDFVCFEKVSSPITKFMTSLNRKKTKNFN